MGYIQFYQDEAIRLNAKIEEFQNSIQQLLTEGRRPDFSTLQNLEAAYGEVVRKLHRIIRYEPETNLRLIDLADFEFHDAVRGEYLPAGFSRSSSVVVETLRDRRYYLYMVISKVNPGRVTEHKAQVKHWRKYNTSTASDMELWVCYCPEIDTLYIDGV